MNKKLDWEYVASVEKAIAEKYGKQTVQDFRSEWDEQKEKEYLAQLKNATLTKGESDQDKVDVDGILISKKASKRKYDRTCPVCKTYSFSMKDDLYMNRFKCCHDCYVDFVIGREQEWKNGDRPTEEHLEYALRRRK